MFGLACEKHCHISKLHLSVQKYIYIISCIITSTQQQDVKLELLTTLSA